MSGDADLERHLAAYLAVRDALGLAAGARPRLLRSFLDHVRGATKPVTDFARNNAVYAANKRLDRDHDGVACEAH